jgi:N-acetyltransferase
VETVALTGRWVTLEPLDERHREGLRGAADDPRIWPFMHIDARGPEFDRWFNETVASRAAGAQFPFAVRRNDDGRWAGSTSYLDFVARHRRVEIGWTWYNPSEWATATNPECKLLLLAHAFEVLGMNRVTFCTDLRNLRSQAAIAKLGAVREGILRRHAITQGGYVRDTVVFGIVAEDWPAVKVRLQARVSTILQPMYNSSS